MTDQQNSESNQEYNHVPEGAVQPPMVGEEQNPQNNKDKEAYVLGDSLLSNNEMKLEKRVGSTLVLSIALFFGNYIPRMVSTRRNRTYRMDNYATAPFSLYYHCDPPALERKDDGE